MKTLLKALLPPFTAFAVFFLAVRYSTIYFTLRIDKMGTGDMPGFMAFNRYTMPLLFVVAVLTQLLIVNPIFRNLKRRSIPDRLNGAIDLGFICLLFAISMAYPISGFSVANHFIRLVIFMTGVQLFYWAISLLVLHLLK